MHKIIKLNRRQSLKAASALASAAWLGGCGEDGLAALPDDLETYAYAGEPGPENLFAHGVASGDPTADAVIVWTRVSPSDSEADVDVFYEVAVDESFKKRVAAGTVVTNAARDFTVKVDIQDLVWERKYFFRFHALGRTSPIGRTNLAPAIGETVKQLRFGVCSCSSYAHGYFHGYRWLAARADLDAVLHVGDYIYEYGTGEYGELREYEPPHEIVTLADYRLRYAQYRRDPDLQLVHARHPMIVIWDDHETADNSHRDGAENHQPETEGDWHDRKAAALKAYLEWLPIRETPETAAGKLYRHFPYGELADIVVLDTRIVGRDKMLEALEDETPDRSILGKDQEAWLASRLQASQARWKILAQQVVVAQTLVGGSPFNIFFDDWDGYPSAQQRLFDLLEPLKGQVAVLTGDVHSSWANEIARDPQAPDYDRARDNFAVEFVTPGITSPGVPISPQVMTSQNPNVRWVDFEHKGYFTLDITPDRIQADWFHVAGVEANQGEESFAAGYVSTYGSGVLEAAEEPVSPA